MERSKTLFICNTPFQLFNALRLRYTVFCEGEADIILSDHSQVNKFSKSVKKTKYFKHVYKVKSLTLARQFYFFSDDKKDQALWHPKKFLNKVIRIDFTKYDNIFTANVDGFVNLIYRDIVMKKAPCKINCYEDGWVTYTMNLTNFGYSPFERHFHEVLGGKIFQKI